MPARPDGSTTPGLARLDVESRDGVTVVRVVGEVDVSTVPALRGLLSDLAIDGSVEIVLDLCGVDFMDSAGIGALVTAQRRIRTLRGVLAVACDSAPVLRVLHLTGMDKVLSVHPSVADAIALEFSHRP